MLILSCDRPVELSACGANQAIDQVKLFGDQAVGFFDLSQADPSAAAMSGLRRTAAQAFFRSQHSRPGAVQLNARLRKPLEPGETVGEEERELQQQTDVLLARPITRPVRPRLAPDPTALDALADLCIEKKKGLIVCGPAALEQASLHPLLEQLARHTGYPLLVEGASQLRFLPRGDGVQYVDAFDLLLGSKAAPGWQPELILQIGRMPTAAAWERFIRGLEDVERWILAAEGWNDPTNNASVLLSLSLFWLSRHCWAAWNTTALPCKSAGITLRNGSVPFSGPRL
jgi:2-succinyl-5-enolpyruvyl-6-hydroxy-3-cyclohexene-1-carboxylate synthase